MAEKRHGNSVLHNRKKICQKIPANQSENQIYQLRSLNVEKEKKKNKYKSD